MKKLTKLFDKLSTNEMGEIIGGVSDWRKTGGGSYNIGPGIERSYSNDAVDVNSPSDTLVYSPADAYSHLPPQTPQPTVQPINHSYILPSYGG